MSNNNNAICAICGFALGHHRHGDNACPNTNRSTFVQLYRQTKFEFKVPDQSETMKMKGPDLQQIPKEDALGKVARATVDKVNSIFKIITDNDKQRIEQAFNDAIQLIVTSPYVERGGPHNYSELISRLHNLFNPVLEAERSELRNKVIEECITALHNIGFDATKSEYSQRMFARLNSLKTK